MIGLCNTIIMSLLPAKLFTDREIPKQTFLDALITPQAQNEWRIITFYGVGGEGKSALYNYFQDRREDQEGLYFSQWAAKQAIIPEYKIASVNFAELSFLQSHEAMMQLRQDLVGSGIDFFNFDLAFLYYFKKQYPHEDIQDRYQKLFQTKKELISDITSVVGDLVGAGEEIAEAGKELASDSHLGTAIGILATLSKYAQKLRPKYRNWYQEEGQQLAFDLEQMEHEEVLRKLPDRFGDDIARALEKRESPRLVIMMDTFEAVQRKGGKESGLHDAWVRDLVTACPSVLFVILGRDKLKWDDYSEDFDGFNYSEMLTDTQHLLGSLSDEDAHLFLEKAGIYEAKHIPIRNAIVEASKGHPFYLDLQVEMFKKVIDKVHNPKPESFKGNKKDIIDRFVQHLSDYEQDALKVIGQARIFNKAIFEHLKTGFFTGSPLQFHRFVEHSFVQHLEKEESFKLHQLMQEYLQQELEEKDESRYKSVHESLFDYYDEKAVIDDVRYITQEQEEALLETNYHKQHTNTEEYLDWFEERTYPFTIAARYLLMIPLRNVLVDYISKTLGKEHLTYAINLNNLALLFKNIGHYEEAKPLYYQAIDINKKALREEHPAYATCLSNLAGLYEAMGCYEEAEPLYHLANEINKKTLGEEHPNYASGLSNLALLLKGVGRYEEAEPLYYQAIEINKKTLGEEHPNYASGLSNLAGLFEGVGRYEEAEPLFRQALEIIKNTLGEEHPTYATSLNNLALLLNKVERYKEAKPLYRQAIEITRKILGEEHPAYAIDLNNFATLLKGMGCYEEAELLFRQAIETSKKTLGEKHPDYATSLNNLALLLKDVERYEEAEPLFRYAIEIAKNTLGEEHPDYATHLNNLALLLESMERYEEAEPLFCQTIELIKNTLGEEHPNYVSGLNNLAGLFESTGRSEEAEPLYRQTIEINKKVLGEEYSGYATHLNNLALLLENTGRFEEAEPLYRQVIEINKRTLGEEDSDYAISLNNLAGFLESRERYEEAEPLYRQALEIDKKALGEKHPDYAISLNNLAGFLFQTERVVEAIPLIKQAHTICLTSLGSEHSDTQHLAETLKFFEDNN